ncbi:MULTISPECIES: 2'-5' RNA ligase family protein [unclassified Amycolatopsis]|uniref:2'-5' RNA ligase family protein n=1 Tax=unclassified Amycolatopsis TaxID=2618356 RepID=UPI00196AACFF|nr:MULTISPECIES: 2'-5' RNA ligase family protein [unclassified Amycolatopsis]
MPTPGTSALVVTLPTAAVLLEAAAAVDPGLVRPGLPPHVTALYPFLPAERLTEQTDADVTQLAASFPVTEVQLTDLVLAPGFVAAAAPALQPLADAVCDHWPDVPPYGGRFGAHPPAHLTIALGGTDDQRAEVAERARAALPLTARADTLHLVVLTEQGWQLRLSAPLGIPAR